MRAKAYQLIHSTLDEGLHLHRRAAAAHKSADLAAPIAEWQGCTWHLARTATCA